MTASNNIIDPVVVYADEEELPHPIAQTKTATTIRSTAETIRRKITTREGILGDFDYAYLFTPRIPFYTSMKERQSSEPTRSSTVFFGLNSSIPLLLGIVLGLQHCLAMLAGIITPPIIISSMANLTTEDSEYLVSASLIACGFLSMVQIIRFRILKTKYYIGTGLLSVVGTSFSTISVVSTAFPQFYKNGFCPSDANGKPLPCPDAYGALLGTCAVCGLIEVLLSFCPPKILQKIFPPLVTGPVVLLIGTSLVQSGFQDWVGGSGCATPGTICPSPGAPHALPWGSAQFIGLGFLAFVCIVLCEKWGSPFMKSCSIVISLIIGCIVAAACGYFDRSTIDAAPVANFMWVKTFRLSVAGNMVLPVLSVYIVCMMETIGDVTATSDVSRQPVEGDLYDSRIQGGVLADGLNSIIAALMTITPMSTFAQNNGVISLTQCANRVAGLWACFFLIIMGIFSKFAGAIVAIPKPVLGGVTTFLFSSVAVSGIKIISSIPFTRRDRFVLTASLMFGFAALLVPNWFSQVFTYQGDNNRLKGLLDAVIIFMETPYSIAGFVGVIVNLVIRQEFDVATSIEDLDGTENVHLPGAETEK
ncbi:Uric acid-xanthine permease (UAPA transporter) [Sugiyamaella lignohabitans]|uniref:Uric acid-xanthine permease (UAPA transporter) n=1 Tax=Sugiyamaella lignohabitans TaxID=796027 RepID=A0A167EVH7_9ASCO|nr:Uric acid-xanthine permease (UAPA transporter) [Sugiyamaella lignohabitans]ANB14511.1 Uric acid-xanthine permease (UAPA transporter) [Sugiyamaella lignohabitans]